MRRTEFYKKIPIIELLWNILLILYLNFKIPFERYEYLLLSTKKDTYILTNNIASISIIHIYRVRCTSRNVPIWAQAFWNDKWWQQVYNIFWRKFIRNDWAPCLFNVWKIHYRGSFVWLDGLLLYVSAEVNSQAFVCGGSFRLPAQAIQNISI